MILLMTYCFAIWLYLTNLLFLLQFRKRVFQWCRCSSATGLSCCFCCRDDKQRHLEKCQSFYTGLSRSSNGNLVMGPNGLHCSTPNTSKTRFFTGPNRVSPESLFYGQLRAYLGVGFLIHNRPGPGITRNSCMKYFKVL